MTGWKTAIGQLATEILREAGELRETDPDAATLQAAAIRFVSKRLLWRITFIWNGGKGRIGMWPEFKDGGSWATLNGMSATCGDTLDEALAYAVCNARNEVWRQRIAESPPLPASG